MKNCHLGSPPTINELFAMARKIVGNKAFPINDKYERALVEEYNQMLEIDASLNVITTIDTEGAIIVPRAYQAVYKALSFIHAADKRMIQDKWIEAQLDIRFLLIVIALLASTVVGLLIGK